MIISVSIEVEARFPAVSPTLSIFYLNSLPQLAPALVSSIHDHLHFAGMNNRKDFLRSLTII